MFLGESHPGIAACYNNIGEMYDLKGDSEKAMEYYKRGLDMKLQCNAPVLSTVLSLCSTAKMMIPLRQFKEAHSLLDDGFEKLKIEKLPPKEAEACVCHTKGLVYKEEGRYNDAKEMFRKAVEIRQNIAPNNIQYIESLSHLADIYKIQGYLPRGLKYCERVLQLKEQIITSTPHTLVIADSFDRMADIYNKQDNTHRYIETLEELQSELLRLERVFLCHQNERDLYKIRYRLRNLDACFKVVHCGIHTRNKFV
jgi:tetratricopeptide (TPR) repeat protein